MTDRPSRAGPLAWIAPLLFALYPVVALYAHNYYEVDLPDLWPPIVTLVGAAVLLFVLLRLVSRSAAKAGVLVTIFFLFSFAYSGAIEGARELAGLAHLGHWVTNKLFLALWSLGFLAWGIFVLRARSDLGLTLRLFVVSGTVLLLLAGVRIVSSAASRGPVGDAELSSQDEPPFLLTLPDPAPDVYYLVFDRYASGDVLQESFGFDNHPFTDYLRERGFIIDDGSITNYPMTHTSLASSLNMEYLGPEFRGPVHYARMIERNRVGQIFTASGYRYDHIASWYEASAKSAFADELYRYAFFPSEFTKILAETTPYHLFLPQDEIYRQVRASLDHVEKLIPQPGPKYVFAHLICPHAPYVVRPDGSYLDPAVAALRTERENYLEQVQFVNMRVKRLVDRILKESRTPPIIVIQADEGPLVFAEEGKLTEDEVWHRRAGILNAYYLPPSPGGGPRPEVPHGITPVNTFRFLFARYFHAPVSLLEDRLYFWPEVAHNGKPKRPKKPFPFIDITDRYWSGRPHHDGSLSASDSTATSR
ncbi:MAG: hypothetical protein R3E12_01025 [Candidatus Eisenbacteria bacterium]